MQNVFSPTLLRLLTIVAMLLIWKVTFGAVMEYGNYFPPNFESDFLRGREPHFWGAYQWAFYAHLVSGPTSLLLGTVLVSNRLRRSAPSGHRWLGRLQTASVLLLVVPSGLWMAFYAATGSVAAVGLGLLAVATAACVVLGWRSAIRREWEHHRRWMWRTFILLCSAVVIRLIGGLATVAHIDAPWLYPLSAWTSWLVPLLILEISRFVGLPAKGVATPT